MNAALALAGLICVGIACFGAPIAAAPGAVLLWTQAWKGLS